MNNCRTAVYFDLDGVLADWVAQYNKTFPVSLEQFNSMTREERGALKSQRFNYDFFRTMSVIEKGLQMFREVQRQHDVYILTAVGDYNIEEVTRAKVEWVRQYICPDVRVLCVRKLENKPEAIVSGYDAHILIDDRERAIAEWRNAGYVGILFENN